MKSDELLQAYDDEVRGSFPHRLPDGWIADQDGPLTRCLTDRGGFAMLTADASQLGPTELDALVDRTFRFYAPRVQRFEWKTFDHDRGDLQPLLRSRGAVPEPHEALVLGDTAALVNEVSLPSGLSLRAATSAADLERVAALGTEGWAEDASWLADDLRARLNGPTPIDVFVVENGDRVVSAAWLVPLRGTRVAGLWGGSTLAAYRGRGIYRALVTHRARVAIDRGYTLLQADASDDSRPILEKLGLHVVGGTVPYVTSRRVAAARDGPSTSSRDPLPAHGVGRSGWLSKGHAEFVAATVRTIFAQPTAVR